MSQEAEKRWDKKSNRTKQKNKTGDSEVESNDSPEIPDRAETADIPGLLSRDFCSTKQTHTINIVFCSKLQYTKYTQLKVEWVTIQQAGKNSLGQWI